MASPRLVDSGVDPETFKPRKRYSDSEALSLLQVRGRRSGYSLDPTQSRLERLWFRCVAALAGYSGVPVESLMASLDSSLPLPASQAYNANLIMPLVSRQVARLTQSKGNFTVLPQTPDYRDTNAARVGEHLVDYWHDHLKLQRLRAELAAWMTVCGQGYLFLNWDFKAGATKRVYAQPFDSTPLDAKSLSPEQKNLLETLGAYEDRADGDLVAEALSPFQVMFPNRFTTLEAAPYVIIESYRSMEWLFQHYSTKAKDVRPSRSMARESPYWHRLASLVHDQGFPMPGIAADNEDGVLVREYWQPPSKLVRDGAHIVVANDVLMENSAHVAVTHKVEIRFPVWRARFAVLPGRAHGMSMVEHLIGPMDEYNKSRDQVITHRNRVSHPQWLMPRGAKIHSLRVEIGDVWEYEGVIKPELQSPPAMSQTHVQTAADARGDMNAIASQNEASQGINPAGVRSGLMVQALSERDMETISPSFDDLEECFSGAMTAALMFTEKCMATPRVVELYGESRAQDLTWIKGDDLRGNNRVRVKRGSMQPKSKSATLSRVLELMEVGALNPQDPQHARFVFRSAELGELDENYRMEDMQRRRARQEDEEFLSPREDPVTGITQPFPDVNDFDDDVAHIEEHTRTQLGDQWRLLPIERQMAHKAHIFKHQQKLRKQLMAQMMANQTQGGAGGPGGGSPPAEKGKPSQPKRAATG